MISFKHKFIFIHIPKTGGTSLTKVLGKYSDDNIRFGPSPGHILNEDGEQGLVITNRFFKNFVCSDYYLHASFEDLYQRLNKEIFKFYIFTIVRNPYDRVISHSSFTHGIKTVPLQLQNFTLPRPQLEYLKLQDQIMVNNIIRFENFQSDFDKICKDLDLPKTQLPHIRKSKEGGYHQYYTEATKKMVYRVYRDEFDYFGYNF